MHSRYQIRARVPRKPIRLPFAGSGMLRIHCTFRTEKYTITARARSATHGAQVAVV
jgi:hypothetical protein